jgi:hypothetical protein
MEGTPSWKASGRSACKEIRRFSCNSKVNWRVHNSPTLVLILSELRPAHTPQYILWINFKYYFHPCRFVLTNGPINHRRISKSSERLGGPLGLLKNGHQWLIPLRQSSRGMTLTIHLNLMPRLRNSGFIPPHSHAFSCCAKGKLRLLYA